MRVATEQTCKDVVSGLFHSHKRGAAKRCCARELRTAEVDATFEDGPIEVSNAVENRPTETCGSMKGRNTEVNVTNNSGVIQSRVRDRPQSALIDRQRPQDAPRQVSRQMNSSEIEISTVLERVKSRREIIPRNVDQALSVRAQPNSCASVR